MAQESPHGSLPGEGVLHIEQTPPGDPCASSFTLDTGDFMGWTLGGGDPVDIRPGGTQVRSGSTSGVDGQLPCLEGHNHIKELFPTSFPPYSAYDHSEGNCLFDPADPTQD